MIFLVGASAVFLTASQAAINAPRSAFQACLKQSVEKAAAQKVAGEAYEDFVRQACGGELNRFKTAVIGFDMTNKMSKKDAAADADIMVADFVSGSADHYKYVLASDGPANSTPAKPVATPASAPVSTPPK